jgi:O-antigen ligase
LIAACFVVGTWFSRQQERGWAWYSRSTAIVFAIGFAAIASGSGGVIAMLAFTIAIVLGWAWLSAISVKLYRAMGPGCTMS